MNVHLVQEILFILSGIVLFIVALAVAALLIRALIFDRGQGIPRKKRMGREERPQ